MPKIFGLNLAAVLAASVAFYFVGFLWYGLIFSDIWMAEMGIPASAMEEGQNPLWMVGGFVITVMQAVGIGLVLKWKSAANMNAAIMAALILWITIAVPFAAYGYLYGVAHSLTLFMIDASHLLVGWVVSAIILSLIK